MQTPEFSLTARDKLPDALRVLLEERPREAWEGDPNFSELIRFWLERHLMFRRLVELMNDSAEKVLDRALDETEGARHLSRYGSMFVQELHGHHMIEDQHYFPRLKQFDTRLIRGFDILDRDHHEIDDLLAGFADSANTVLRAISAREAHQDKMAEFQSNLVRTKGFLDRHLTDEEDLVVPVLLKYAPPGLT